MAVEVVEEEGEVKLGLDRSWNPGLGSPTLVAPVFIMALRQKTTKGKKNLQEKHLNWDKTQTPVGSVILKIEITECLFRNSTALPNLNGVWRGWKAPSLMEWMFAVVQHTYSHTSCRNLKADVEFVIEGRLLHFCTVPQKNENKLLTLNLREEGKTHHSGVVWKFELHQTFLSGQIV